MQGRRTAGASSGVQPAMPILVSGQGLNKVSLWSCCELPFLSSRHRARVVLGADELQKWSFLCLETNRWISSVKALPALGAAVLCHSVQRDVQRKAYFAKGIPGAAWA